MKDYLKNFTDKANELDSLRKEFEGKIVQARKDFEKEVSVLPRGADPNSAEFQKTLAKNLEKFSKVEAKFKEELAEKESELGEIAQNIEQIPVNNDIEMTPYLRFKTVSFNEEYFGEDSVFDIAGKWGEVFREEGQKLGVNIAPFRPLLKGELLSLDLFVNVEPQYVRLLEFKFSDGDYRETCKKHGLDIRTLLS